MRNSVFALVFLLAGCPNEDVDVDPIDTDPAETDVSTETDDTVEEVDTVDTDPVWDSGWGIDTSNSGDTLIIETDLPSPGDTSACPWGEVVDCNGGCFPKYFLGDGTCDDGSTLPANFDCDFWQEDRGDCAEATDTDTDTTIDTDGGCRVDLRVSSGQYGNEIGWTLYDQFNTQIFDLQPGTYQQNYRTFTHPMILTEGTYTLRMRDDGWSNDGWEGGRADAIHYDSGVLLMEGATLPSGMATLDALFTVDCSLVGDTAPPPDCNDVTARFFGVGATEEASFSITNVDGTEVMAQPQGGNSLVTQGQDFPFTLPDGVYNVNMFDSAADGWQNSTLSISQDLTNSSLGPNLTLFTGPQAISQFEFSCDPNWTAPEPTCTDGITVAVETGSTGSDMGIQIRDRLNVLTWSVAEGDYNMSEWHSTDVAIEPGTLEVTLTDADANGWVTYNTKVHIFDKATGLLLGTMGNTFINGGSFVVPVDFCSDQAPSDTDLPPVDTDDLCGNGAIEDCDGQCWPSSFLGDGFCDDGTTSGANFFCDVHSFDFGDCAP